jgi:hypothetical protein
MRTAFISVLFVNVGGPFSKLRSWLRSLDARRAESSDEVRCADRRNCQGWSEEAATLRERAIPSALFAAEAAHQTPWGNGNRRSIETDRVFGQSLRRSGSGGRDPSVRVRQVVTTPAGPQRSRRVTEDGNGAFGQRDRSSTRSGEAVERLAEGRPNSLEPSAKVAPSCSFGFGKGIGPSGVSKMRTETSQG